MHYVTKRAGRAFFAQILPELDGAIADLAVRVMRTPRERIEDKLWRSWLCLMHRWHVAHNDLFVGSDVEKTIPSVAKVVGVELPAISSVEWKTLTTEQQQYTTPAHRRGGRMQVLKAACAAHNLDEGAIFGPDFSSMCERAADEAKVRSAKRRDNRLEPSGAISAHALTQTIVTRVEPLERQVAEHNEAIHELIDFVRREIDALRAEIVALHREQNGGPADPGEAAMIQLRRLLKERANDREDATYDV